MKDKKGKTCTHKLRRRWQWTKISEANNLESSWRGVVCAEATRAPGISGTAFLSRMCLFTVVLCHLVALFFLTMCSCKTESYLPLKTIISPDKCQQRILSHMHRDLLFLAVSMLLAIPMDFVRRSACEVIIDFVFLKAICFSGYLLSKVYG